MVIMLVAAPLKAQQPQPQQPDAAAAEHRGQAVPSYDELQELPDITKWLPIEQFAREMEAQQSLRFTRSTFSTDMVIPKAKVRTIKVAPDNNSVKFGRHFSISNGSAGNWGVPYPSAFLDARTLSFPAPRR